MRYSDCGRLIESTVSALVKCYWLGWSVGGTCASSGMIVITKSGHYCEMCRN